MQYVTQQLGLQVCAIARLSDLLQYLALNSSSAPDAEASSGAQLLKDHYQAVLAYRERYGVN